MARERMVTRTIESTIYTVMMCNINKGTVSNHMIHAGVITGNPLKVLQKMYDTSEEKIVAIVDTRVETELYGMTEAEFMRYAKVLPPR